MSVVAPLRTLLDPPLPGAVNMGRDEALLNEVAAGRTAATLRFYAWDQPTISLGYFQSFNEIRTQAAEVRALPVVRRTTGGGAILHDRELTYSLALPMHDAWLAQGPRHLYRIMHMAIIAAVGGQCRLAEDVGETCGESTQRGPFFCFSRRHALDVVLPDPVRPGGWAKLAGSAQRRVPTAVLQHGSIMLGSRFVQQACAAWGNVGGPHLPDRAASMMTTAIGSSADRQCAADEWNERELAIADTLCQKYASREWTEQR